MLRVLVVDDEPRQRKILSRIIRDCRNGYEVMEAKNGEAALELCKEAKPDIVFSDIRMPRLDGLSMIEGIYQHNQHAKIVVVSGYSDFDYAQRALNMRVYRYLLKPIEDDKIRDIIQSIEASIQQERNSRHEKRMMADQLNQLVPLYIDHLMNRWIRGTCTQAEFREATDILRMQGRGYVMITRVDSYVDRAGESPVEAEDQAKLYRDIRVRLTETLNHYGHVLSFFSSDQANEIISIMRFSEQEDDSSLNFMDEALQALGSQLYEDIDGIMLSIGTGEVLDAVEFASPEPLQTAETALRCQFYLPAGKVVAYEDIRERYTDTIEGCFPYEEELRQFVHGYIPFEKRWIDAGLEALLQGRYPRPEALLDEIGGLLIRLHHGIQNMLPEAEAKRWPIKIKQALHPKACSGISRLMRTWIDLLEEMAAQVQDQKDNKVNIVMERCLQYIHRHFDQDFSLEELAKKYYFNASYFSTLFKKYTGKHFTGYIIDLRIEIAYRKLLESDKKVYEIAHEVGYRDVKYFNKVFKKRYGFTPEECRIFGSGWNAQ